MANEKAPAPPPNMADVVKQQGAVTFTEDPLVKAIREQRTKEKK